MKITFEFSNNFDSSTYFEVVLDIVVTRSKFEKFFGLKRGDEPCT